jgi:rSAM/selenodomain-associated transferase 1
MAAERLIVFTRYPEIGMVKTRLIPTLGPERATELHRMMAEQTIEVAREVVADRRSVLVVRYTGATREAMADWLGDDLRYQDQGGGGLGERLQRAFDESLGRIRHPVVAIGTDCPELTSERIGEAFDKLRDTDLVLGPADDGGYYLIGLSRPAATLFHEIAWGTDRVLEQTWAAAVRAGLTHLLLDPLHDIDRPEDLERIRTAFPMTIAAPPKSEERRGP